MSQIKLNLARKWRSRNFNQIIGQQLPIRMLKNSLYRGQFFPVYLFSGQRGCGKTTSARVFATALNCAQLSEFQNDPRSVTVPCLACESCKAMLAGSHPDFIEIDAASHTGVDNVRNIIEASSLMPLLGGKKIYLIDEAHMLSKAAFNAFLKILEEPPASVLFILATTDPEKIIETVRSRCFQLFFKPIDSDDLLQHLQNVCLKEEIRADKPGLELIVKESGGSARDALNMVEQIRFSSSAITKLSVLQVLGHIDDERLIQLLATVLTKSAGDVLQQLSDINFEQYSAPYVWRRLIELTRALVWIKYGVSREQMREHHAQLEQLAHSCSLQKIHRLLRDMYASENLFLKTTAQHLLLEMLFIRLAQKNTPSNEGGSSPAGAQTAAVVPDEQDVIDDELDEDEQDEDDDFENDEESSFVGNWKQFVQEIEHSLQEPLLISVFKQGEPMSFNVQTGALSVACARNLHLFNDMIEQNKHAWHPLLKSIFGMNAELHLEFTREPLRAPVERKAEPMPDIQPKVQTAPKKSGGFAKKRFAQQAPVAMREQQVDVSDAAQWPKAHILLKHFPGRVTEIREQINE